MKSKFIHVLFWIKSSRGTEEYMVFKFKNTVTEDYIKERLEQWGSTFTAWNTSNNYIQYGFNLLAPIPRKILLKEWDEICKQYNEIATKRKILMAKLTPHE